MGTLDHLQQLREAALERRRDRLRAILQEAGLEALIAYGTGNHYLIGMNPAWYYSGLKQLGPHMAMILPAEGEPFTVITPQWELARAQERIGTGDVVACEPADFLAELGRALDARRIDRRRVAFAGGIPPRHITEGVSQLLGGTPHDGDGIASDMARIRDDWSLACTNKAIEIAEQSYDWMLERARPGMTELELGVELDIQIRRLGAEDNFQLFSGALHNRSVHRPTDRILQKGDVILAEITPGVEGEFMQICRTAVLGQASELQKEKFALLDGALKAGVAIARPGTRVDDIVEAMNAPINAAGYGQYTKPPYMRTRGHSMSLGSMDPEIALGKGQVLMEGMAFVMHPNQYIPDTGYMLCGEPVFVEADGARPMTRRYGTLDSIV